jgi:8-oxo-dGTP diphosphatase
MNKKQQYTYPYPRPMVTVDVAVLRLDSVPEILLVERRDPPFRGMWALPGGFMEMEETLEEAARRELKEETGLTADELIRFDTYDAPGRDPRGRTITQVFIMMWKQGMGEAKAASDARSLGWFDLTSLPDMAFDHERIITDVVDLIRNTAK